MKRPLNDEAKLTGVEKTIKDLLDEAQIVLTGPAIESTHASRLASQLRICADAAENLRYPYSVMCLRAAAVKVLSHNDNLSTLTAFY